MKTDVRGCSSCPAGQEHWEKFEKDGLEYVQYDRRTPEGVLYSCIRRTLEQCRAAYDVWYNDETDIKKEYSAR